MSAQRGGDHNRSAVPHVVPHVMQHGILETTSTTAATGVMGADVPRFTDTKAEQDGFAAVFHEHHAAAVRLAYLLVSDADQAQDVVADAFVKVYRQWRKDRVRDVGAYIRRAVANEANSRLRRRYLERFWAQHRSGDARGVRRVDDHTADSDEVWSGLQRLPEKQRIAIVLRYFEDLPEAETAEVLGVSVGTVKSQVSRGLSRLEELLATSAGTAREQGRER